MLGKDIVNLIYKFLHQALVRELNQEYYVNLAHIEEEGTVRFWAYQQTEKAPYKSFMWNYRMLTIDYLMEKIYNWKTARIVGILPKLYK